MKRRQYPQAADPDTERPALTSKEAAQYLGVKLSYLYKLVRRGGIPHYKPGGKLCFFVRHELDDWITANRSGGKKRQ